MIDSVLELVNKTASNSLFMFLFCNFIIILILVGHTKPGSQDDSYPGLKETMLISDPVLSSKSGFERSVLIPEPVLSPKPGIETSVLISASVLSSESGFKKSEPVFSSKPGLEKPVLISKPTLTSKSMLNSELTYKPGLQEPRLISMSSLSSKPTGTEQSLTSKPELQKMSSGLKPGSEEKGTMKKESLMEVENESEVECVLRRRVEEFIRKVNIQWKSENTKSDYLLY